RRNLERIACGSDSRGKLGHFAQNCNLANPVAVGLSEPKIAIGTGCNSIWGGAGGNAHRKLGNLAFGRNSANPAAKFGEPDIPIRSKCNPARLKAGRDADSKFRDHAGRRDSADSAEEFAEPKIMVGPDRDFEWLTAMRHPCAKLSNDAFGCNPAN